MGLIDCKENKQLTELHEEDDDKNEDLLVKESCQVAAKALDFIAQHHHE